MAGLEISVRWVKAKDRSDAGVAGRTQGMTTRFYEP